MTNLITVRTGVCFILALICRLIRRSTSKTWLSSFVIRHTMFTMLIRFVVENLRISGLNLVPVPDTQPTPCSPNSTALAKLTVLAYVRFISDISLC